MSTYILMPDGTRCWSGGTCKKHSARTKEWVQENPGVDYTKLSKTLAYVLRHKPEAIGITLKEEGWVQTRTLVEKINHSMKLASRQITLEDIHYVVQNDSKSRYSLRNDEIRAVQGHSTNVDMKYVETEPPEYLYHGTTEETWALIQQTGLKAMQRQFVHLSTSTDTALNVGRRHGKKVVLIKVKAKEAHALGAKFYLADNGVWLSTEIPNTSLIA